jgi:hypothetical protein
MAIDRSISLYIQNGCAIDCALMHTVANPTVGDPVFREKGRSASNQVSNWSDGRFGWIEQQIKLTNLDIVFIIQSFAHIPMVKIAIRNNAV